MKKLIFFVAITMIFGCKNDDNFNRIIIKGTISSIPQQQSGQQKTKNTLSLLDAKKVLVFSKYYYEIYDIIDGNFSAIGQLGTGIALIFLDANNKYIGNLSNEGLNMLPLGNLSNGENTTIDLSLLSLVGNSVIPSHDPFGKEIIISDDEINSLKVVGEYFESLAKNIDANNDGVADILTKTHLVATSIFGVGNCGSGGYNITKPIINDAGQLDIHYSLSISGGENIPIIDKITLSGPAGDPYPSIYSNPIRKNKFTGGYGFLAAFSVGNMPGISSLNPFKKGTYTVTIDDNKSYTLDYSSFNVFQSLVFVIPTIHTNIEGKLTSISLEYKYPNGKVIENPANILTNIMAQVNTVNAGLVYVNDRKQLTAKTGFTEIVPDAPVDISTLHHIDMCYQDLLGNEYIVNWKY